PPRDRAHDRQSRPDRAVAQVRRSLDRIIHPTIEVARHGQLASCWFANPCDEKICCLRAVMKKSAPHAAGADFFLRSNKPRLCAMKMFISRECDLLPTGGRPIFPPFRPPRGALLREAFEGWDRDAVPVCVARYVNARPHTAGGRRVNRPG